MQRTDQGYYESESAPSVELTVSDGEEKNDVTLAVQMPVREDEPYQVAGRPMPDDFELTPGTYDLTWDPTLKCAGVTRSSCIKWDYLASFDFKKKPQLVSANPRYWIFPIDSLKGGRFGIILDESKGTGTGYDTVYMDLNRDWDLTNDPKMSIGKIGNYEYGYTEWAKVLSNKGSSDGKEPGCTTLRLGAMWSGPKGDELYGHVWQEGGWKGTIQTNNGPVECALVDYNTNGKFNDHVQRLTNLQVKDRGDLLFADTNGSGKLALMTYGSQSINLDPVCKVGQKFYQITPSPEGDELIIEPYSGPMGTLVLSAGNIGGVGGKAGRCQVIGKQGSYMFTKIDDGRIELPCGDYRISSVSLALTSGARSFNLECGTDSPVSIEQGNEARIDVSGSITSKISPKHEQLTWKAGESQAIDWQMKVGDEVAVTAIGDRTAGNAPRVKFFDKTGKMVHMTTADYT